MLLELSGRLTEAAIGSPGELEARAGLTQIFLSMRKYGPELKAIQGEPDDRADDGRILPRSEWKWPPRDVCAPFSDVVEAAILDMGFGSRSGGLDAISCHPTLPWNSPRSHDEAPSASFRARDAEKIEKRWLQCYGMAKLRTVANG